MKGAISSGDVSTITVPSGGVTGGVGYLIGNLFAVASSTLAAAEQGAFVLRGMVELDKATGQAWTIWAKLYWDDSAKKLTTTASGNTLVGVAGAIAASGDTRGRVILNGINVS